MKPAAPVTAYRMGLRVPGRSAGWFSTGTTRLTATLARTATLLLVLAVLAASGASFAISEGLKVQRAAVTAVHVDKIFSPVCRCPQDRALVGFKLTRSDRLTLGIVDSKGALVRTLVHRRLF